MFKMIGLKNLLFFVVFILINKKLTNAPAFFVTIIFRRDQNFTIELIKDLKEELKQKNKLIKNLEKQLKIYEEKTHKCI